MALTDLAERLLGVSVNSIDLFSDFNPASAAWVFQIEKILRADLNEVQMSPLYEQIEQPTLILLSKMESIGIAVDQSKLSNLKDEFSNVTNEEINSAYKVAGHEFNVNSPKQLQAVLFEELKLPKTKKIKTGFTTDAESLAWLDAKTQHPILKHLLRIRETSKLLSTVEGLISAINNDGRIHTNFQQTVAATGRLSSTDPNLQNIPIRSEEGRIS